MEGTQHTCRIRVSFKGVIDAVEMGEIIREREQREGNDEGAEDGALQGQEEDGMEETEPGWPGRWEQPCYCRAMTGREEPAARDEWSSG